MDGEESRVMSSDNSNRWAAMEFDVLRLRSCGWKRKERKKKERKRRRKEKERRKKEKERKREKKKREKGEEKEEKRKEILF